MSLPELIPSNLPVFTRKYPRSHFANSVIPEGAVLFFAQSDSHSGVRFITKNHDGTYTEVGGSDIEVTAGYLVNTQGNITFHTLTSDSLSESVSAVHIVNTGVQEPAYSSGGGGGGSSMNFYKCASVDTSNSEWNGHLAIIDDTTGAWDFSSDSTQLSYNRFVPIVGKVYDENCTFRVEGYKTGLPENGLILYASLSSDVATCESGQTVTNNGVSFTEVQGIPCASFGGSSYLDFSPAIDYLTGSNPFTICWWEKFNDYNTYPWQMGTANGDYCVAGGNYFYCTAGYINGGYPPADFHFCYVTYDGTNLYYYINNSLHGPKVTSDPNNKNTLRIGTGFGSYFKGYVAAFRIYNRVLTSEEISALANEFTPTSS